MLRALRNSVVLSAVTAFAGAVIGGILAYAVSTAQASSVTKRFITSLCGVLAQFGGVALAFAFIASFGATGLITLWLNPIGIDTGTGFWIYEWNKGLMLVYLYFQIPLMVIVFLPAVEGLRPQWREATETLGGTTWTFWRRVAGPILLPSFVGAMLLLFTNAFSAYATAKALISQGTPLLPLQIAGTMSSRGHPRPGERRQGDGPGDDRGRRGRHDGLRVPRPTRQPLDAAMSGQRAALRRRQTVFRWASLVLAVAFFAAPLLGRSSSPRRGPAASATPRRPGAPWSTSRR